jgi:hypothetical protein
MSPTARSRSADTNGATGPGQSQDFEVQDGLMFNALQAADKVIFAANEMGGVKTITKIEKQ